MTSWISLKHNSYYPTKNRLYPTKNRFDRQQLQNFSSPHKEYILTENIFQISQRQWLVNPGRPRLPFGNWSAVYVHHVLWKFDSATAKIGHLWDWDFFAERLTSRQHIRNFHYTEMVSQNTITPLQSSFFLSLPKSPLLF